MYRRNPSSKVSIFPDKISKTAIENPKIRQKKEDFYRANRSPDPETIKEKTFLPYFHQRWRRHWRNENQGSWKQQHTEASSLLESYWSLCTISCSMESMTQQVIRSLKLSSTFFKSLLAHCFSLSLISSQVSCNNKVLASSEVTVNFDLTLRPIFNFDQTSKKIATFGKKIAVSIVFREKYLN